MANYKIIVLGTPKSQKRHRSFRKGKYSGTYDPSSLEKDDLAVIAQKEAPEKLINAPINLEVFFYFGRPKRHYRTGSCSHILRNDAETVHSQRPDADNLLKFVLDSLTGVFWKDDNLIYKITVWKLYNEKPRTEIFIQTDTNITNTE